jgi:hypothetical protein
MRAAVHLRHYYTPEKVVRFLQEYTHTWEREVPTLEITKTVHKAFAMPKHTIPTTEDWPKRSPELVQHVCATTKSIPLSEPKLTAWDVLQELWPASALLCCGPSQAQARTQARDKWVDTAGAMQFIVPNNMSAAWGVTSDGRESPRCLTNTGPREWLVIECDTTSIEDQARILAFLSKGLPLGMVVHSGGKSLHGWFRCQGLEDHDHDLRPFFRLAVKLGADAHTWPRCQWVRMPGGIRQPEGVRQKVVYWNPKAQGDKCPD